MLNKTLITIFVLLIIITNSVYADLTNKGYVRRGYFPNNHNDPSLPFSFPTKDLPQKPLTGTSTKKQKSL